MVWNREAGIGLARAVASSCSVPGIYPPITIRGRHYIDGGMRSATNADVAKGYDAVLVVAVTVRVTDPIMAERFSKPLENELKNELAKTVRIERYRFDRAATPVSMTGGWSRQRSTSRSAGRTGSST